MTVEDRFLDYVSINSESSKSSKSIPSSEGQLQFAKKIEEELKRIGLSEVEFVNGVLYGKKESNSSENEYKLGFITHLDTYPMGNKSSIEYIVLDKFVPEKLKEITGKKYPLEVVDYLEKNQKNNRIVFSKGKTNLGADDKAAIAVIVTAIEKIINLNTRTIYFAFVTDEEIGIGSERIDFNRYKADYSIVLDGQYSGEICVREMMHFSCFISAKGRYSFLGDAHKTMVNSIELLCSFINRIDERKFPQHNEAGDVFVHFDSIEGDVTSSVLSCTVMSSDESILQENTRLLYLIADEINALYNEKLVRIIGGKYNPNNSYNNNNNNEIVEMLRKAYITSNINPKEIIFKGITDSISLRSKRKNAITIGVGCGGFHSIYEWASITDMENSVEVMVNLMCMK